MPFKLVDKRGCIKVIIPSRGDLLEYDWKKVHDKLGVYPDQVIDYKALRGDTSDCIPGYSRHRRKNSPYASFKIRQPCREFLNTVKKFLKILSGKRYAMEKIPQF